MTRKFFFWILPFVFSAALTLPVILPYLRAGYFPTHDGEWAVVRAVEMFREVRDFQFPPRYSGALNFGYGYPLFNFAYPLPYYLTTIMHFFHIGFVDSVKILFASSVVFSAFFMFLASKKFWQSTLAGAVSTILYIYFPYRMVDLYTRGSLGESVAFALFPLLFYLILMVSETKNKLAVVLLSFAIAALVLSHNIMAVYFFPILVVFVGRLIYFKKENVWQYILSLLLGILLPAYFWLPAIVEKQYISLSQIPIADRNLHFVTLDKLLFPRFGYGASTDIDGFSYQLGIAHIIIVFLLVVFFIKNFKKTKTVQVRISIILLGVFFLLLLLLFPFTSPIWASIPILSEINYPWTLLAPMGFLISFLSGYLAIQKIIKYIVAVIAIVAIIQVLPYAKPKGYLNRGDSFYMTNHATTTSSDEYMPLWVKQKPEKRWKEKVEIVKGEGEISNILYTSNQIAFEAKLYKASTIQINTIYYPGWNISVNGTFLGTFPSGAKGVMTQELQKGEHSVKAVFRETNLRIFADIISISALVFVIRFLIFRLVKYFR